MTTKVEEQLRIAIKTSVTGNYFSDEDDLEGNPQVWEPFENWEIEDIEDQIDTDVDVLISFIKNNKDVILNYLKEE